MNKDYWRDKCILIIGASSDLCSEMLPVFSEKMSKVGMHCNRGRAVLNAYENRESIRIYQQDFFEDEDFNRIIDDFCVWAGTIDFLIIMTGNCLNPVNWINLDIEDMQKDYYINTIVPLMLCQRAISYMRQFGDKTGLGMADKRIILTGTASAQNAGGSNSLSYGAAKLALECIMKRMAKDCAKDNILINMVCPGFIKSKFQTQIMKRSEEEIQKRAEFVPLKRSGTYKEVAEAYFYLLSEGASFVTGEVLNVKGGDWI